jgi:ribosome-associated protein
MTRLPSDGGRSGLPAKSTETAPASRTQKKRAHKSFQALARQLLQLSRSQLAAIDMPSELHEAVAMARRISSHGARRRQLRHIGAMLARTDTGPVTAALENIRQGDARNARVFKTIERWRDELTGGNTGLIGEILALYPAADRRRLTQLARSAHRASVSGQGVKASRKLFRYLKEIADG